MKTKSIFLTLAIILTISFSYAQDQNGSNDEFKTLFTKKDQPTVHGGYAGLTFGYSDLDGKAAMQIGGRLAWVINHQFAFGVAGNGFFNNLNKPYPTTNADYSIAGGYGGFFFQPIIFPKAPVHISFPILLGAGGVAINPLDKSNKYHWDYEYSYDNYPYDYDYFLVLEPGVDVEFNLLRYLRMSVGASYRFTNNVNLVYEYQNEGEDAINTVLVDQNALNNFTFHMAIIFGWF